MEALSGPSAVLAQPVLDPTSSLRAAALSTLKSKRRKPAAQTQQQTSSSRPPPPFNGSFQLDYGDDDNGQEAQKSTSLSTNVFQGSGDPPSSTEVKDVQMREEGEISDEEGAPPLPLVRQPSPRAPANKSPPHWTYRFGSASQKVESQVSMQGPSLLDRISDPPNDISRATSLDGDSPNAPILQNAGYDHFRIGLHQVRPGLPLTQTQYDVAKDIVLDLLGWGVPPEYLVDCGLTREIVYYVFIELNLRLPTNLDTTGLIPYTPETVHKFASVDPESPLYNGRRASIASSAPSPPPLPPKISNLRSTQLPPQTGDLHDMERRRREELMARKAVQASRKTKRTTIQPPPSSEPTADVSTDIDMASVPSETVDDFLKTITPGKETIDTASDHNDVDIIQIPGLGTPQPSVEIDGQTRLDPSPTTTPGIQEPPPSSTESISTTFTKVMRMSPEAISASDRSLDHHIPQRRGTKRPVASDFVDFDGHARDNGRGPHHDHDHVHNLHGHPIRRKTGGTSFVNIRPSKCVIDLSDSEVDDESEDHGRHRVHRRAVRPHSNLSPAPLRTPSTGAMTPTTLQAKEMEIQKMRELIAQREQKSLLKKLGLKVMAINSNGPSNPSVIKQEDDDSATSSALSSVYSERKHDHSESSPPPPDTLSGSRSQSPVVPHNKVNGNSENGVNSPAEPGRSRSSTPWIQSSIDRALEVPDAEVGQSQNMDIHQEQSLPDGQGDESVDVDPESSSSAQIRQKTTSALPKQDENQGQVDSSIEASHENFASYDSPFASYPLLRLNLQSPLSGESNSFDDSPSLATANLYSAKPSFASSSYHSLTSSSISEHRFDMRSFKPNLKPLKLITASKLLDPYKRICQYEIPGGGVCRDGGCEDLHLSRLSDGNGLDMVKPNDQDTAEYLYATLPQPWLVQNKVSPNKLLSALQHLRLKNPASTLVTLEDRVARALISLGLPPPLPPLT